MVSPDGGLLPAHQVQPAPPAGPGAGGRGPGGTGRAFAGKLDLTKPARHPHLVPRKRRPEVPHESPQRRVNVPSRQQGRKGKSRKRKGAAPDLVGGRPHLEGRGPGRFPATRPPDRASRAWWSWTTPGKEGAGRPVQKQNLHLYYLPPRPGTERTNGCSARPSMPRRLQPHERPAGCRACLLPGPPGPTFILTLVLRRKLLLLNVMIRDQVPWQRRAQALMTIGTVGDGRRTLCKSGTWLKSWLPHHR